MVHRKRLTAGLEGDFVVFLIGMRINKPWNVHKWWPVAAAMPRMIKELYLQPELGFIHAEAWFSRGARSDSPAESTQRDDRLFSARAA